MSASTMPQLRELDLVADVNAFVENLMLARNLQFSDKESLLNVITAHLQASARPTKEVAADSGNAADGPHAVWVRPRVGDVRFGGMDADLAPVVLPTAEAKLSDLRSLIGKTLQWPQERVQRITFTRTLEDGGMVALSDAEPAMSAHGFYLRMARQATTARPTATRASLAALQRELLKGIRAAGLNDGDLLSVAVVRELQATILPQFGFDSSPSGIKAMEAAIDYYLPDSELLQRGDEIGQAIGMRQVFFDISTSKL